MAFISFDSRGGGSTVDGETIRQQVLDASRLSVGLAGCWGRERPEQRLNRARHRGAIGMFFIKRQAKK